jgi:uncharacterized protein YkwD
MKWSVNEYVYFVEFSMFNYLSSSSRLMQMALKSSLSFLFFIVTVVSVTSTSFATPQEYEILQLTNQQRIAANLKPLKFNDKLVKAAREQSNAMAKAGKLSHSLHGQDLVSRVKKAGYWYVALGENIGQASSGAEMVKMWMSSENHKQNILNPQFTSIGIGIKVAADGKKYYTQVFAKGKKKNMGKKKSKV